ncbi:MAG: hypothetical protein ACKVK8_08670 [Rhodospirillales bacterium]
MPMTSLHISHCEIRKLINLLLTNADQGIERFLRKFDQAKAIQERQLLAILV